MSEIPRCGLRPLRINSEKKYLSRSVRINNNNITDLYGIPFILSSFLAQPSKLGWLDLSFNKITHIDVVLCELQELRVLYLHCNSIKDLIETDKLGQLRHLHTITMHGNAIEFAKDYRKYVIWALPHLKKLDFSVVTRDERNMANIWCCKPVKNAMARNNSAV